MAKKIFKGIGSALGIGKKKKPAEAAPVEDSGTQKPVITGLADPRLGMPSRRKMMPTILGSESDTFG